MSIKIYNKLKFGDNVLKRANTEVQAKERNKEIIKAVSNMFDIMDYQDISMKTISENISIARSSLYCYYNNKEEIMLDVLKDDYLAFLDELTLTFKNSKDKIELTNDMTKTYLAHKKMLKIVSIHLIDIETHASLESLIDFKKNFIEPFKELNKAIKTYFKNSTNEKLETFNKALLMLTHSLYPMIEPNFKQKKAMERVGMDVVCDKYNFTYNYINFLISNM